MIRDGTCIEENDPDTGKISYTINGLKGLTVRGQAGESFDDPTKPATNGRYNVTWQIWKSGMANDTYLPVKDSEQYVEGEI